MSSAPGLTNRDIALVVMLARGHTTDRVAREMRLSRHTVGERISTLLERFRCRNRTELVAYFYACGLLETGTWPPDSVVGGAVRAADPSATPPACRLPVGAGAGRWCRIPAEVEAFRYGTEGGEANVV